MAIKTLSKASPLSSGSYKTAVKHFYISSKIAIAQITDLYDFVYPSVTALWNLRYEVTGYLHVRGEAVTKEELNTKFSNHEKFNNPNLYRSCIEFSWEKQKEDFAKIILINLFAYHEAWIENILTEIGANSRTNVKALQFPSYPTKPGAIESLATLTTHLSGATTNAFYPVYSRNKKYNFSQLNNLLICYRYFKEVRNAIIHSGGLVDQKLLDIEAEYNSLNATDIGLKVKPIFEPMVMDEKIKLSIEDVCSFTDIILQIITTMDAELIKNVQAEAIFMSRIKEFVGTKTKKLNPYAKKPGSEIRSIVQQSGFEKPERYDEIQQLFTRESVVR